MDVGVDVGVLVGVGVSVNVGVGVGVGVAVEVGVNVGVGVGVSVGNSAATTAWGASVHRAPPMSRRRSITARYAHASGNRRWDGDWDAGAGATAAGRATL